MDGNVVDVNIELYEEDRDRIAEVARRRGVKFKDAAREHIHRMMLTDRPLTQRELASIKVAP